MPAPAHPVLEPGRVYRTRDLTTWGKNPTRLAKRLLRGGQLHQLAHGLFYAPKLTRFGAAPPDDEALLRGFLDGDDFVTTGPPLWNALGLGATAQFSTTLVYNSKRSGAFDLGGRRFQLRRVKHPRSPTPEWYAVDLIEHREMAGLARTELEQGLRRALAEGRLDRQRLRLAALEFGTKETQTLVEGSLRSAAA